MRSLLLLVLLGVISMLIWTQRDGFVDDRGTALSILDVLYFTVVTVTTTGFGDIVPVSDGARAMVTFGITPFRIVIWLLFISTAYQLVFRQHLETIQLSLLKRNMKGHTIICGFGVKGQSAADELVDRGIAKPEIFVIDPSLEAVELAVSLGYKALRGNAASESILLDAGILTAATILVAANRDDICVLICLTARDLNPGIRIIAAAREEENVRLIYRSGADTVISPAVAGGRMLAAATESPIAATFLGELIRHGWGSDVFDRKISAEEEGRTPAELQGINGALVLGVKRKGGELHFDRPMECRLRDGDTLVIVKFAPPPKA
jgi:voltage-gated potassium channel